MIVIGFYPCCLMKSGLPGQDHQEARFAVIGKSNPEKDGYDTFLRAYCSDCAKKAITRTDESWAPMDEVYVEFAKRGKIPHPGTTWNSEA